MKAIITFLLLCFCCLHAFAQDTNQYHYIRDSLLHKSRSQKTTAWIMLGAGSAVALGGLVLTAVDATTELVGAVVDGTGSTSPLGPVLMLLGTGSVAGSIPLFIASGKNKRKAMQFSAITQAVEVPVTGGFAYRYQPAISVGFVLGSRK